MQVSFLTFIFLRFNYEASLVIQSLVGELLQMVSMTIGHTLLVGKQENRKIQQHLWQSQIYLSMDEHRHKKCF